MDPIELSDDDDFVAMPARQGPKKVRAAAFRRGHGRIKKPSLKSVESSMSNEQYRNLFGSDSSDVEDNDSGEEEEDVPLRDLKRQKLMSSDEVMQAAGNAHKSLVTLLSSSETLLKEIASEKAKVASANADKAQKAGEIAKLTKEVADLKKKYKKVTDERDKARKEAKKPIHVVSVSSSTKIPSNELVTAYEELIKTVKAAYTRKLQPKKSLASSAPLPLVIKQRNTNPQYLTERAIEYKTTAAGVAADGFYIDLGPTQGGVVQLTDSVVVTALQSLGQMQRTAFVPTPGASCQYSFGGHSYDAFVSSNAPVNDHVAVVFQGSFAPMNAALFAKINALRVSDIDDNKVHSKNLVELAELFSSLGGHNFKYNANRSQVWLKPDLFRTWIRIAEHRQYTDAILLMHGSGSYDGLFQNPAGYDVSKSALNNAMGVGMYQSKTDHIPIEYNTDQTTHQKKGSGLLGLLLRKQNAPVHVYEDYNLGNQCLPGPFKGLKNGIVIRDQSLYLPLGLVVAK